MLMTTGCTTTKLWEDDNRFETVDSYSINDKENTLALKASVHSYKFNADKELIDLFKRHSNSEYSNLSISSQTWNEKGRTVTATLKLTLTIPESTETEIDASVPKTQLDDMQNQKLLSMNLKQAHSSEIESSEIESSEIDSTINHKAIKSYDRWVTLEGKRQSSNETKKTQFTSLDKNFDMHIREESTLIGTTGKVIATPVTVVVDVAGAVLAFVFFLPLMLIAG